MSGMAVQPISATEAVAATLRARIFDGAILPGARLPEVELAADMGVARPTVRAAIQTLCHEGLLQRERNRSAFVPELTDDDVLDLFSVRIPLECLIVREVLERQAPLDGVHEAIGALVRLTPRSRWSRVVDADLGFHRALAHATGSPRLERLYLSLSGEIRLCIAQLRPAWSSPAEMAAEHRALLDVIEAGDVDDAMARMTAHLDRAVHDLTPTEQSLSHTANTSV
jgi:DNA-binding GntR family transcriptional regulator